MSIFTNYEYKFYKSTRKNTFQGKLLLESIKNNSEGTRDPLRLWNS